VNDFLKHLTSGLFVLFVCVGIFTQTGLALSTQATLITRLPTAALAITANPPAHQILNIMQQRASDWQLTVREWQRYQQLMQGVAGHWYTHLDPPEVLGLLANTPEERKHYAELVVQQQKARIDRELAFNRTVQSVWHEAYPHLLPISAFDTRPFQVIKRALPHKKKVH